MLQNYTTGGLVGLEAIRVFEGVAVLGSKEKEFIPPEWREACTENKRESLRNAVALWPSTTRCKPNSTELLENEAKVHTVLARLFF